jgi:hypothetical protein
MSAHKLSKKKDNLLIIDRSSYSPKSDNKFLDQVDGIKPIEESPQEMIKNEKRKEYLELQSQIEDLNEVTSILSQYIEVQKPEIASIDNLVDDSVAVTDDGVEKLQDAAILADRARSWKRSAVLIGSGIGLGAIGFLGGPLVGLAGLIAGGATGIGAAMAAKKNVREKNVIVVEK